MGPGGPAGGKDADKGADAAAAAGGKAGGKGGGADGLGKGADKGGKAGNAAGGKAGGKALGADGMPSGTSFGNNPSNPATPSRGGFMDGLLGFGVNQAVGQLGLPGPVGSIATGIARDGLRGQLSSPDAIAQSALDSAFGYGGSAVGGMIGFGIGGPIGGLLGAAIGNRAGRGVANAGPGLQGAPSQDAVGDRGMEGPQNVMVNPADQAAEEAVKRRSGYYYNPEVANGLT